VISTGANTSRPSNGKTDSRRPRAGARPPRKLDQTKTVGLGPTAPNRRPRAGRKRQMGGRPEAILLFFPWCSRPTFAARRGWARYQRRRRRGAWPKPCARHGRAWKKPQSSRPQRTFYA